MGLFISKQDIAREAVENANLFYSRFEQCFIDNLSLKDVTIDDRWYIESANNHPIDLRISKYNGRLLKLHSISDLFNYYPSILLHDQDYEKKNTLFLYKYDMPCPVKYHLIKKSILKEFGVLGIEKTKLTSKEEQESYDVIRYTKKLILENGAFDRIENCIRELNVIISKAVTAIKSAESGFLTRQNQSALWTDLMVVEYRCKSAIGWFNFLYKQEKK